MTTNIIADDTVTITRRLVPEHRRADFANGLFGIAFPLQLEPSVFTIASTLSAQYRGAYWNFHSLSNDGFYMAPDDDRSFAVRCENGYEGEMSADAFGITVCLYAYSYLSFSAGDVARVYADQYYRVRDYAADHAEAAAIFAAID